MLIALIALLLVAAVPLWGGRYSALADLRLRGTWLVGVALVVQIVIISVIDIDADWVARTLHLATYGLVVVMLLMNRSVRWLWVVTVGWACNVAAIAANGGVMPTSLDAAEAIGRTASTSFENSAPSAGAHLAFLGDTIATPPWLPLANVVSVGDLVLLLGLTLVLVSASREPTARPALAHAG